MEASRPLLIADAGPLVALFRVSHADLLKFVARRVVVPQMVVAEMAAGPADEPSANAARNGLPKWLEVLPNRPVPPEVATVHLGRGETAAFAEALANPPAAVLLDERDARDAALALGIGVIGTLGVFREAKRDGRLAAVRPVVQHLLDTGYRYSPALVRRTLVEVGEAD